MRRIADSPAPTSASGRKELLVKRILALALFATALAFSATLANPFLTFDDSGVDYEDTDVEEAYIAFEMHEGQLVVIVDDEPFAGALPAIGFEVPDVTDREDFWGNEFNADMSNISDIVWLGVNDDGPEAAYLVGLEANHTGASLAAAVEAYDRAFRSLGYSAEVSDTAAQSVKLVSYSNGDSTLQGRFHARAGDVNVTLRSN